MSENFSDWDDEVEEVNLDIGRPSGNESVPNSTAVLVLGILSIPCCCFSIIAVIMSVIALILSRDGFKAYESNPVLYSTSSFKNLKAGRICAIIGLVLSSLALVIGIIGQIAGATNDLNNFNNW